MKIVILGTGNVATQLGKAFQKAGHDIMQIYGKKLSNTSSLAKKLNSSFTIILSRINTTADIYLIAVSDSSIEKVVKDLLLKKQLIVHTSGSIPMNVFKNKFVNHGVFYPVQSVSKNIKTNFKDVPICVEASNETSLAKLMQLAKTISDDIYYINSEQRGVLHLAAVFVNNFANHLFVIAENILKEKNISFDLLKPLINQTTAKIKNHSPAAMQTGPAVRGDEKIISKHLKMLDKYPEYKKIYTGITKSIKKQK